MIPGNRPEDFIEEDFWEELYTRLNKLGLKSDDIESVDADSLIVKAIKIARDLGYTRGYDEGTNDARMEIAMREMDAAEDAS